MNKLLRALQTEQDNSTLTENQALTYRSSLGANVDFFGLSAANRGNLSRVAQLFLQAWNEDPDLAVKNLFWLRDIRGGAGERDLFRGCYMELIRLDYNVAVDLLTYIPIYGRWDDVTSILYNVRFSPRYHVNDRVTASIVNETLGVIDSQLDWDLHRMSNDESISLLAKWLPSVNTSSKETNLLGKYIAHQLFGNDKCPEVTYRKTLSRMRRYLNVLEQKMSARQWENINYENVPSQAMHKYRAAFERNDPERFQQYLDDVESGEAKVNTSTLNPAQIVSQITNSMEWDYTGLGGIYRANLESSHAQALNNAWVNMTKDPISDGNVMPVVDVSGSMFNSHHNPSFQPIAISVSLGIYLAETNTGSFANHFITFSGNPELVKVKGSTIVEKVENTSSASWGGNTNLQAVFDLVLNTARRNNVPSEEMPQAIVIISDMEFDHCVRYVPNYEEVQRKYQHFGYELPLIIFWNVDSKTLQVPVTKDQGRTMLLSGCSTNTIKTLFSEGLEELLSMTPEKAMLSVLLSERYEVIHT